MDKTVRNPQPIIDTISNYVSISDGFYVYLSSDIQKDTITAANKLQYKELKMKLQEGDTDSGKPSISEIKKINNIFENIFDEHVNNYQIKGYNDKRWECIFIISRCDEEKFKVNIQHIQKIILINNLSDRMPIKILSYNKNGELREEKIKNQYLIFNQNGK